MGDQNFKVFYKGKSEDFVVFAQSEDEYKKYKKNPDGTPLIDVVSVFNVYGSRTRGSHQFEDAASKRDLEHEFGSGDIDTVISKILLNGQPQGGYSATSGKYNSTNDSNGSRGSYR